MTPGLAEQMRQRLVNRLATINRQIDLLLAEDDLDDEGRHSLKRYLAEREAIRERMQDHDATSLP